MFGLFIVTDSRFLSFPDISFRLLFPEIHSPTRWPTRKFFRNGSRSEMPGNRWQLLELFGDFRPVFISRDTFSWLDGQLWKFFRNGSRSVYQEAFPTRWPAGEFFRNGSRSERPGNRWQLPEFLRLLFS